PSSPGPWPMVTIRAPRTASFRWTRPRQGLGSRRTGSIAMRPNSPSPAVSVARSGSAARASRATFAACRDNPLDALSACAYHPSPTFGTYGRHAVERGEDERVKTSLLIPKDLLHRLKVAAAEERTDVSRLLCRIAEEW